MKNQGSEVSNKNPKEGRKPNVWREDKNKHFERLFN